MSAGDTHTCALTTSSTAYCWGGNGSEQLGNGPGPNELNATVPVGPGVLDIAAGGLHTCGINSIGLVVCWGANYAGQLGVACGDPCGAFQFPPVTDAVGIAAGYQHTCVLIRDGSVQCWGSNANGQLGDGGACGIACTTPQLVTGLGAAAVEITAKSDTTCARLQNGVFKCWGFGGEGMLGTGGAANASTPANMVLDSDDDGCSDGKEVGVSAGTGGDRNLLNGEDFYDVPVPALRLLLGGTRNQVVSLAGDVGALLSYVGLTGGSPDYIADYDGNSVPDGRQYDRRPSMTPGKLHRSAPLDGAISLAADVATALAQVGHVCGGPP
jgi:alpha-tubulin suppressor-like RCC1 family protein